MGKKDEFGSQGPMLQNFFLPKKQTARRLRQKNLTIEAAKKAAVHFTIK